MASKTNQKLESLAYRLCDLDSLRKLFEELNFEFSDDPVGKLGWTEEEKCAIGESKIVANKFGYRVYYLRTRENSFKHLKTIASKIIKADKGMCLVCSHNPDGFKWIFSILSNNFSPSFTETRHLPLEIHQDTKISKPFIEFLEDIRISQNSNATTLQAQIANAFDMFAVQIHDELTENVFEALKTLSKGIINHNSNNLKLTEESLELIREPVLILLYRMIFVLYAEDRGVFPIDHTIYYHKYSMKYIKNEWILKNPKLSDGLIQERLTHLFELIENGSTKLGYSNKDFEMRSYYGRLFDSTIHNDLTVWKIPNQNLLEAISLLTRTKDKNGDYFFLDYAALETIHLGAIYERLLEYRLSTHNNKISSLADAKERKASGSYYTPKPIVDHIVRHAIEPLIENCLKTSQTQEMALAKIFSLKILDPAMGSGHFLVGATNYMAKRICEIENNTDEQHYVERKRDVVRQCIYGVDLNPLAVDLAMVTLWLETLSSEKPLSFLSAHLKCGNSLVGSTIDSIFDQQTTIAESMKSREGIREIVKKFLSFEKDDNTAEVVKTKTINYQKMQEKGTVYYDLKVLLDLKTAEAFGHPIPDLGDYRAKIGEGTLDHSLSETTEHVGRLASENGFFHWELEFLHVYYDKNAVKKHGIGVELDTAFGGFDIVIGNPPWERLEQSNRNFLINLYRQKTNKSWTKLAPSDKAKFKNSVLPQIEEHQRMLKKQEALRIYLKNKYVIQGRGMPELFKLFMERSVGLLSRSGSLGLLVPSAIYSGVECSELRKELFRKMTVHSIIAFENRKNIFPTIDSRENFCIILAKANGTTLSFKFGFKHYHLQDLHCLTLFDVSIKTISRFSPEHLIIPEATEDDYLIKTKMVKHPSLGSPAWPFIVTTEFQTSKDKALFRKNKTEGKAELYQGSAICQFEIRPSKIRLYVDHKEAQSKLIAMEKKRLQKIQVSTINKTPIIKTDAQNYRVAWRAIARNTDNRTMISTVLPPNVFHAHSIWSLRPMVLTQTGEYKFQYSLPTCMYLCGIFNSVPFDYLVRQLVYKNVSKSILQKIPVPAYDEKNVYHKQISKITSRLIAVGPQYTKLRKSLQIIEIINSAERKQAIAAVNAYSALAYSLTRKDLLHILSKFHVQNKKSPTFQYLIIEEYDKILNY